MVVGTMAPLDLTPLAANQTGAVSALISAVNLGLRVVSTDWLPKGAAILCHKGQSWLALLLLLPGSVLPSQLQDPTGHVRASCCVTLRRAWPTRAARRR